MDKSSPLLLDIWREVGKHLDIQESVIGTLALLAQHLPVERLLVRRMNAGVMETVAEAPSLDSARPQAAAAQRPGEAAALTVALGASVATRGELILLPRPGRRFDAAARKLARALRDPFTTALENDHRLRDMRALREAAEADRRSLLTRLGREALVDEIVGTSTGLAHVMERVAMVAPQSVPVLILGDTGTGKEVVARAIHARSPRQAGPFHRVNCGAIPPELLDSELFGHERGAFTGAVAQRRGWFERADGGTLFLDEIGELSLAAQIRLLTVVQDGWVERVGGHAPVNVDVRIVAATHRDLTAMVRQGRFREDLWYRLAVFTILLPPLRERPEDVPALAAHFARRAATRFGLPLRLPEAADLALLSAYDWPGNIRELGAVIDRAAILGEGRRLEVAAAMGAATPGRPAATLRVGSARGEGEPAAREAPAPGLALDDAMRAHIERALRASGGRIEGPRGAAKLLGVNPHTLRGKMRKLGIEWGKFRNPKLET